MVPFAVVFAVALALGIGFHKAELHIEIRDFVASLFMTPAEKRAFKCTVALQDGVCVGPSLADLPPYEKTIAAALEEMDPAFGYRVTEGFPDLLATALGYRAILPPPEGGGARLTVVGEAPYRGGTIKDLRLTYAYPAVALRALFAVHGDGAADVLIVLHGLGSSADKVMGLDNEDYTRAVGRHYFDKGFDIVAMDLTSDPNLNSAMNVRLILLGTTIHGLSTRAACDAASTLDLRRRYRQVIVYGLSNGGFVADYLSVLCEPFSLVVVDDVIGDARMDMWANPEIWVSGPKYPMFIHYLRPLFGQFSLNDLAYFSKSPKAYIGDEKTLRALKPRMEVVYRWAQGLDPDAPIKLVFKQTKYHMAEIEQVLDPLFAGDWRRLKGASLLPLPH